MKKYLLCTALIAGLFSLSMYSQFSLDGEFRSRFAINHGQKVPVLSGSDAEFSLDQRSRLISHYQNKKYAVHFTLQDARVLGSDDMYNKTGVEGNSFALGVYEAWVNLKLTEKSAFKIGRQAWNYNDMRILSARNWWTSGMSYDGLLYTLHDIKKGWYFDLGISYNNNGARIGVVDNSGWIPEKIKTMNFINIKKQVSVKLSAALMFTLSGKVDTSNNAILGTGTHGLFIEYNRDKNSSDGFFGALSFYYQHGTDMKRDSDMHYRGISSYLTDASIGVRTLDKKLEIALGAEAISGQDFSNSNSEYNKTRQSFDLLYSARFPYYAGQMNHFLIQESYLVGTKGGGFLNPYLKSKIKVAPKGNLLVGLYFPQLTTKVRAHTTIDAATKKPVDPEVDNNGNPVYWEGSLGSYIDLTYTHKLSKDISLKAGLAYAGISDIKNQMVFGYEDVANKVLFETGQNYFAWIMLSVKPNFLNKQ
jgi:hypothetical protein